MYLPYIVDFRVSLGLAWLYTLLIKHKLFFPYHVRFYVMIFKRTAVSALLSITLLTITSNVALAGRQRKRRRHHAETTEFVLRCRKVRSRRRSKVSCRRIRIGNFEYRESGRGRRLRRRNRRRIRNHNRRNWYRRIRRDYNW